MRDRVLLTKGRTSLVVTALVGTCSLMMLVAQPLHRAAAANDGLGTLALGLSGEPSSQLMELVARKARLEAEKSGADRILFPAAFTQVGGAAEAFAEAEVQLFEARQAARENQKAQIHKRIDALKLEITGLKARKAAKSKELELVRKELKLVASLHKRQLTNDVRLIGMEREQARFEGDIAEVNADMARLDMLVGELELQVAAVDQEATVEAARELATVQSEIAQTLQKPNANEQSVSAGFAPQPRFEPLSFGQAAGIASPLSRSLSGDSARSGGQTHAALGRDPQDLDNDPAGRTLAAPDQREAMLPSPGRFDYLPHTDDRPKAKPRGRVQPDTDNHVDDHATPHNKRTTRPKTAHRSKATHRRALSRSRLARPGYTIVRATKRGVRAVGRTLRELF